MEDGSSDNYATERSAVAPNDGRISGSRTQAKRGVQAVRCMRPSLGANW